MIIKVYDGTWKDRTGTHVNQPIMFLSSEHVAWASVPDTPVLDGKMDKKGGWYKATSKLMALLVSQFNNRFHVNETDGHLTLDFHHSGSIKL